MAQANKLNAKKVEKLTEPGRYGDGAGLCLQVRTPTNRSWIFRYMRGGKAKWLGLGDEQVVSLAQARQKAAKARDALDAGIDPIEQKKAEKAARKLVLAVKTFSEVSELFIKSNEVGWRNDKHKAQWRSTLATYASPVIGKLKINQITTDHVFAILEPIWTTKTETATRVRGRIENVLDFATARGWRSGENPARWRGHLDHILPAKSKVAAVEHHAALPWREIPDFMVALRAQEGIAAQALELLIRTAARSGEVRGALWGEFDLDAKVWTVPAARMKAKKQHRVPLCDQAIAVLKTMKPLSGDTSSLVFPGMKSGKPLSDMSLAAVLKRMKRDDITVHGFRSTFRDWVAEVTSFPREIAEAALAHTNKDKVEAAYLRGDHFDQRRALMEQWQTHCTVAAHSTEGTS
jgi:integrase